MGEDTKVATERTVVRNPFSDDPNAGIIVAAGDPIPAGAGLIQNTPNKVDAAANYEVADAADKASNATPATRVVAGTALSPEAQAEQDAIAERVAANRQAWVEGSQLPDPVDADKAPMGDAPSTGDGSSTDEPTAPADMTKDQLAAAYGDLDGFPKSGTKAEMVEFVNSQKSDE